MGNENSMRDETLEKYATYLHDENTKHVESLNNFVRDVEIRHNKSLEDAHNANSESVRAGVADIRASLVAADLENSARFTQILKSNRIGAVTALVASGMGIETAIANLEQIEIVVGEMAL